MRKLAEVRTIDTTDRTSRDVASEIVSLWAAA
jgi:hypothetical protein